MAVDPISLLQLSVEKLDVKIDKTNDKVDIITELIGKQLVLAERLTNFEINSKESINRLHERVDGITKRVDEVEHNQATEGCNAHKQFIVTRNHQLEKYETIIKAFDSRLDKLTNELHVMKEAPKVALGKIGSAILAVLGTAIGGWVLIKFGMEIPK